jgi:hypothetical protein
MPYLDKDMQREAVRYAKHRFDVRAISSRIQENKEDLHLEGWDLRALNKGKYTPEQKVGIVTSWVTGASLKDAARHFNVPFCTVRDWKYQGVWWLDTVDKVRKDHNEDLDTYMTGVMDNATQAVVDRIKYGDFKYDTKTGETVRVPMAGRDLAVVTAIYTEKRALLRGEATSISITKQDPLKDIEKTLREFAKFSSAKQIEGSSVREEVGAIELGSAADILTKG